MIKIQGTRPENVSRVLSSGASTPPANPEQGDIHIVGSLAAELWHGQDYKIAIFTGGRWSFQKAREGDSVWVAGGYSCIFHQGVWHKTYDLDKTTTISGTSWVTTTSKSFLGVPIAGMLWTPPAGTYLVDFSSNLWNLGNTNCVFAANRIYTFIAMDGVRVSPSLRTAPATASAEVAVNGSQEVQARWFVQGGTGSMVQRTLSFQKV